MQEKYNYLTKKERNYGNNRRRAGGCGGISIRRLF